MHLKEMKQIADARTKSEWFGNVKSFHAPGFIQMAATTPLITADDRMTSDQAHLDGEFIAMAANNWDKLIAVVDAAIGLSERSFPRRDESDDYSYIEVTTGDTAALKTALNELEK